MNEQIMVFSKEWFKKHNKTLCWFANAPIIKYWFRWLLRIHKDIPWNEKIEEIMPNAFTYGKKLVLVDYVKLKNGEEVFNHSKKLHRKLKNKGLLVKRLRKQITTDFRTHDKFSKRLYFGLKPFWYLLHFWDYATVLEPKLNLGFDTLTVYPVPGITKDGEVAYQNLSSGVSFSTARNANGTNAFSSTNFGVGIQSSNVENLWSFFHRYIGLFDTSSLTSAAIISAATISFNRAPQWYPVNAFSTYLSICSSNPSSNTSLQAGDYQTLGDTSFSNFWINSWASGYNDLALNSSGLSNISKTGISKFGARIKRDLDNDPPTWAPSKMSSVPFFYANTTGTTEDPKLVVIYTLPVAPTVTTQSATNISTTSCTGNGNIIATGGANCTRRGFCYKVGTSGDPTTSDSVAYDDGSFGTGAFTKSITGLKPNTSYRVRAYAVNSAGTSYGTTVNVTTLKAFKPRTMWFN
jgi:hypothetical protein